MKPGIAILGAPRSGTTLLRRLVDGHPNIACGGESFVLKAAAQFIQGDTIVDGIDYGVIGGLKSAGFDEQEVYERLRELCFGFLARAAQEQGKPRWATKTAVDSFYLSEIDRIFGEHMKFICLVRHGGDVVCSTQDLSEENEVYLREYHGYVRRFPRPLVAFAHAWRDLTESLLAFGERNPNALLIRYEDLIDSPDEVLKAVCDHLEEPYHDDLLDSAFARKNVHGIGDWKTFSHGAIHSNSVGRYRKLSPHNQRHVGEVINPLLIECGYEPMDTSAESDADSAMRRYELSMMFNASESS
jgi:hypothetical protein